MTVEPLRERQSALTREAVLAALVRHLEAGDADALSMEQLAREAGVSRRTLYRHFPTRPALLAAAGELVRGTVLGARSEIGPAGVAAAFLAGVANARRHPRLTRALLRTDTGRSVRGAFREARVESIREVVRAEAPALTAAEVERAAAILAYLCSLAAWSTLQEESGLDDEAAAAAVEWAIELVLADVRSRGARSGLGEAPAAPGGGS